MRRKLSALLFIFLGLLHTRTVTSYELTQPKAPINTLEQAEGRNGADLFQIAPTAPLQEVWECLKIFLLGLGSVIPM